MDQKDMPIVRMLEQFQKNNKAYFNIPSHHFGEAADPRLTALFGKKIFASDLTETDQTDDLHAPGGAILLAQQLCAGLFQSDACYFVVNGSSAAIEAMLLGTVREGEKILLPRNAHKSVCHGLILTGAKPVWYMPSYHEKRQSFGSVSPECIRKHLEGDSDIRAVLVVSPTYYGDCSDLRRIAEICHERGVPLLVDEAHGTHLQLHEKLPNGAVASGADLTAQSFHKTGGSLTQSAVLHIKGKLVDKERIQDALKIVQSTSPSYLLMASLDAARAHMARYGKEETGKMLETAHQLREDLRKIKGVLVYDTDDLTRVVFGLEGSGMTGMQLQDALFQEQITTEMADHRVIVAVLSPATRKEEVEKLVGEMRRIARNTETVFKTDGLSWEMPRSECVLTPREAFFLPYEVLPAEESEGRICAEMIAPYPPGIPLLYPGERISGTMLEAFRRMRKENWHVQGIADGSLETIRVLRGGPMTAEHS